MFTDEQLNVLDSIAEGILVINRKCEVLFANRSAIQLLGYSRKELIGVCFEELCMPQPSGDGHSYTSGLYTACRKGKEYSAIYEELRQKDGTVKSFRCELRSSESKDSSVSVLSFADLSIIEIMERTLIQSEERYYNLVNNSPDAIFVHENGKVLYANKQFLELLGRDSMKDVLNKDIRSFFTGTSLNQIKKALEIAERNSESPLTHTDVMLIVRNKRLYVEMTSSPLWFRHRRARQVIIGDRTSRKKLEQRLARGEARFRAMVENISDSIVLANAKGEVIYITANTTKLLGYTYAELIGKVANFLIHPKDQEHMQNKVDEIMLNPGVPIHYEFRIVKKNGKHLWVAATGVNLLKHRDIRAIVYNFRDITKERAADKKIAQLAFYDSLTGLPNRSLFRERFEYELALAHRNQGTFALIFLDLNHFKEINDTLGHDIGDILLKEVSKRLKKTLREVDTICRLGGDEFVILINGTDHVEAATDRIISSLRKPIRLKGEEHTSTISIGIARFPQDATTFEDLIKDADIAMYWAKSHRELPYCYYHEIKDLIEEKRKETEQHDVIKH